ncbi:MAG: hypothetical protein IJQ55_05140, partial [Alphaproteobacteria bacterium]|nr:hypothetical protein [Alphaproteobacteria bacterium]
YARVKADCGSIYGMSQWSAVSPFMPSAVQTVEIGDGIMVADGGRYIDSYKFPKTSYYDKHILKRHDPVTIYISARNPELEKKIADAVRPFVRSNEGLIDEMLGYGVSISPETSGTSENDLSVGQQAALNISQIIKSRL